jgi:hypothetical protein
VIFIFFCVDVDDGNDGTKHVMDGYKNDMLLKPRQTLYLCYWHSKELKLL